MGKKVQLTITGRQRDDAGEELTTKQCVDGEYFEKNGSIYLLYEEMPENADPAVKNTIKLKKTFLELTKRGDINTRMVFEPEKEYITDYFTPYGCLQLGIATRSVKVLTEADRLEIQAEYTLTSNGAPISDCILTILAQFSDSSNNGKNSIKRVNISKGCAEIIDINQG